jgi:hypothetical protein
MDTEKKGDQEMQRNSLRIRAGSELPSHKVAASLDDLERDILEMH